MKQRILSILVLVSALFMLVMTGLSNAGVFGGRTIEQISYTPHEMLVPSGFTFAIWGPIYLGMLAFAIYQLRKKTIEDSTMKKVRLWVILNFLANGLWLPAATVSGWNPLTVILIIFMRISLGYIVKHLQTTKYNAAIKRCTIIPMSVYFSWITVATPLNIASVLNEFGLSAAVQALPWILLRIGIAYITSLVVFTKLRNISYIAVTVRALFGIIMKRQFDNPTLMRVAIGLEALTIAYIIYRASQKKVLAQ